MTVDRTLEYLKSLLRERVKLPQETEWVEFVGHSLATSTQPAH